MTGDIRHHEPLRDQLPENGKPALAVEFGADAKGLDPVVAEPPDAFGRVADEHIDEMLGAKPLAGAVNRR